MKKHGLWSSFTGGFSALCCAGSPAALAFLTGVGLGFLINDLILFPFLFVSLGFMFSSLHYNKKQHLTPLPLYVAIGSTVIILVGIFFRPIIWLGIIGLFVATVGDFILMRNCEKCDTQKRDPVLFGKKSMEVVNDGEI